MTVADRATVEGAMPAADLGLADVAQLRQGAYRLLGALFLYPETERWTELVAAAPEFQQYEHILARFAFFDSWRRLMTTLSESSPVAVAALESEYMRLFLVSTGEPLCAPYESAYLTPPGAASGAVEAQLQGEYVAAGVVVSPGLAEPWDHVAIELEFMAHLCAQEASAWEEVGADGDPLLSPDRSASLPTDTAQVLDRQRAFLHHHLAVWFPAFARQVVAASPDSLYARGVEAGAAFIHHDRDFVALLMEGWSGWKRDAVTG